MIDKPGTYVFPMAEYLADPCPAPSLNSSMISTLLDCPRKAWAAHPRLGNLRHESSSDTFDMGTAAHAMFLEGKDNILRVEAKDWRTKVAQEARDEARAMGRVALLAHQAHRVELMTAAALNFIAETEIESLDDFVAESVMVAEWETVSMPSVSTRSVWLRCRPDLVSSDRGLIVSYKTTGITARPDAFVRRQIFQNGYDVQAANETLVNSLLCGTAGRYLWLVQETFEPFLCSLVEADPSTLAVGGAKVDRAVALWADCLSRDNWPAYGTKPVRSEAPAWALAEVEGYDGDSE